MKPEENLTETTRKQWNEAAKPFAEFVRSGKNYYSEYMNGPALIRMMGNVQGKRILDVGCGEGIFSRHFAKLGAKVTGVDISEVLIQAASQEEQRHPLGIKYYTADAANMPMLQSESFNTAYCYMAMMDIANYREAIAEVSRLLKAQGKFVIVMVHPCFDTWSLEGRPVGYWQTLIREDGSKEHLYYRIEEYFTNAPYTSEWKHDRLTSGFTTTGFHRTLSDYINTLTANNLVITKLEEPQPLAQGGRYLPSMEKHRRVPQSIVIETTKLENK